MVGRSSTFLPPVVRLYSLTAQGDVRAADVFDTLSQWNITTAGPKTQINAICLISAAATVNADYLSAAGQKTAVNSATDQIAVPESTATGAAGNTDRNQNTVANRASQSRVGLVVLVAALAGALGLLYH